MKAELDEIKQFHSTSVSQRALWFVAATPTVNQVYISESMLSKEVQLLFQTATFYLIFIPGLSFLFPACHTATHLHKSFWGTGWRREEEVEKSRRRGEEGVAWRGPLCYLSSTGYRDTTTTTTTTTRGTTTATSRTTRAATEQGRALHF